MKPLVVSQADATGGANRAAYRLHRALRDLDIDSSMLVRNASGLDPSVTGPTTPLARLWAKGRPVIEAQVQRLQRTPDPVLHSSNLLPSFWSRLINRIEADIVNVHWLGAGTMSIRDIGRIGGPVVLSLHDMWGFSGSEHYTDDGPGARWRTGYTRGNRPVDEGGLDLDRSTWRRKRRHWRPATVVCGSEWLAACARSSALMEGWPVHVIPQALDLSVFRPHDRREARKILGLPRDRRIILVAGGRDWRKGHDLLEESIGAVATRVGDVTVVDIGHHSPAQRPGSAGVSWKPMGHVRDDLSLALLYGAADVVLLPSRQDNLPQVATEALACGTPVVAFRVAGLSDAVQHLVTGYLAERGSTAGLVDGLELVLGDVDRRGAMGRAARALAVERWSASRVARRHVEIYESTIEAWHSGGT